MQWSPMAVPMNTTHRLVLGRGCSGKYIRVEVLTFLLFDCGVLVWCFFSAWSADLELYLQE